MIAGIEDVVQHIDRAHRIGKSYHQKIEKKCKSIIVKFVSFRHRTKVYKKRKNLNDGVTVHPTNIHLQKTSSKRLDQGLYIRLGHMSSRRLARLQDVLQKHLQNIFKTFWRRFWEVLQRRSYLQKDLPGSHFWEIYGQCTKFVIVIKVYQVLVFHFTAPFSGCLQRRF